MAEVAMRYPMRLDGRGCVIATRDPLAIWGDRVRMLLSTYKSQRAGLYDYGTEADDSLFLSMDETGELVEAAVAQAIAEYLPELDDVEVSAGPRLFADSTIEVAVRCSPPNAVATSITTAVDVVALGLNRQ